MNDLNELILVISENVKREIWRRNVSLAEFSHKNRLSRSFLIELINHPEAVTGMSLRTLLKIADALNKDFIELLK